MKRLSLVIPIVLSGVSAFAFPDYEPFADSTGAGGTSYTTGANLIGQTNAALRPWWQAGPGGNPQPTIAAGDLTVPGLYSTGGGQSAAFGGNGTSARLNLGIGAGGIMSDTVYFSFAMKLNDISTLGTGGIFWAGFNNTQGSQTTTPNTVVTRVGTRTAGPGLYNIGLDKAGGTAASFVWAPGNYTTSDTVFIVGAYTFNTGTTTDDISQLWVAPDASTFGAASAPGGALSNTAGNDIARVASFVLYDRNAAEPASGQIDDLRFGLSWADVTPVPEPSALAFGVIALAGLCARCWARKAC